MVVSPATSSNVPTNLNLPLGTDAAFSSSSIVITAFSIFNRIWLYRPGSNWPLPRIASTPVTWTRSKVCGSDTTVSQPTGDGPSALLTSTLPTVISILEPPSGGASVTLISSVAGPDAAGAAAEIAVGETAVSGTAVAVLAEPPQATKNTSKAMAPMTYNFMLQPRIDKQFVDSHGTLYDMNADKVSLTSRPNYPLRRSVAGPVKKLWPWRHGYLRSRKHESLRDLPWTLLVTDSGQAACPDVPFHQYGQ